MDDLIVNATSTCIFLTLTTLVMGVWVCVAGNISRRREVAARQADKIERERDAKIERAIYAERAQQARVMPRPPPPEPEEEDDYDEPTPQKGYLTDAVQDKPGEGANFTLIEGGRQATPIIKHRH